MKRGNRTLLVFSIVNKFKLLFQNTTEGPSALCAVLLWCQKEHITVGPGVSLEYQVI